MKKSLIWGLIFDLYFYAFAGVTENYALVSDTNYFDPLLVTLGSLNEVNSKNEQANAYVFLECQDEELREHQGKIDRANFENVSVRLFPIGDGNVDLCKTIKRNFDNFIRCHHFNFVKFLIPDLLRKKRYRMQIFSLLRLKHTCPEIT